MTLKIVIDARMFAESGIGRYIRNLLAQLEIIDKKNEYFILLRKDDYEGLTCQRNFHKVLADFRWYGASEQIKLLWLLKSLRADLVHFPHFNVPIFYRGKFIVTIHDLIHQHFRMKRATMLNPLFYRIKQFGYKKIFKNAVERSKKILVPSNYVKDLLADEWKIDPDKVQVTYEAVDDKLVSIVNSLSGETSWKPYIFYVGNAHPHKNVEGLIKAFRKLKKEYPDLSLVLSGGDHYFWQKVKKEFSDKAIIYTGYVSDEQLAGLYKNAQMFVLPSFEEGFGIPILEAFACGCPVVSSNRGSLPEVGSDAALYFDPLDINDMAGKISKVLEDKKLRRKLVEKGLRRYKEFNWKDLAEKTLEVYRKCV